MLDHFMWWKIVYAAASFFAIATAGPQNCTIGSLGSVLVKQSGTGTWTRQPIARGECVEQAVDRYMTLIGVEKAEPDVFLQRFSDTFVSDQQWALDRIRAPEAWKLETGSSETKVCVIDSGVEYDHPDLRSNVVEATSFCEGCEPSGRDFGGHGTHIAGVIGAVGNNSMGVSGINWNVSLISCRFMIDGGGYISDAIRCLDWCVDRGAIVSCNSYGAEFFSEAFYDAIVRAGTKGHVFVAAAGNHGSELVYYPAGYDLPNVISVAAVDEDGRRSGYSGYGWTVDIAAPGSGIFSTHLDGGYAFMTGTSMAAPHVAGAVGLVASAARGRRDDILNSSAALRNVVLDAAVRDVVDGMPGGRLLDLYAAVASVAIPPPSPMQYVLNVAYRGAIISVQTDTSDHCRAACVESMGTCAAWTYSVRDRTCALVSRNGTSSVPPEGVVAIGFVSGKIPSPPPPPPPPLPPPPPPPLPPPPPQEVPKGAATSLHVLPTVSVVASRAWRSCRNR